MFRIVRMNDGSQRNISRQTSPVHRYTSSTNQVTWRLQQLKFSMDVPVNAVCRSSNYKIRKLWQIRPDHPADLAKTVSCCIVGSRLDYCNSLLYGIFAKNVQKLQINQNNLARIILMAPRRSSAEPLLRSLHWLPVAQRIKYKIAVLTHRALMTGQPPYLSELLQRRASLRTTRSTNMELLVVPYFNAAYSN